MLIVAGIGLVMVVLVQGYNWFHRVNPDEQGHVSGTLVEWSDITTGRGGPTLRFTITGFAADFRVDPNLFREVMASRVPADFKAGAAIDVVAAQSMIASPSRPPLARDLGIVWVNGLSVNGTRLFDVQAVLRHESKDRFWGYGIVGVALAFLVYGFVDWRRKQSLARLI
jgi:hypothetical protein